MNEHPLKTEIDYLRLMKHCEPLEVPKKVYATVTDCMVYLLNRFDDEKKVTEDMSLVLQAVEPFLQPDDHKVLEHIKAEDAWIHTANIFKDVLS